jgi:septal ring factor EnvC (AmiA/AmiB activator)
VSKVIYLVNSYTIIIRHGEYFSIYSKLKNAIVSAGQEVTARQSIGTVATDITEDLTEMQFQIWKGGTPVNPSGWISQ